MSMVILWHDDVVRHLSTKDAVKAIERSFRAEADGLVNVPSRYDINMPVGWLRIMPAAYCLDGKWICGFKVMNMTKGVGLRYAILLIDAQSGEFLALMDAEHITAVRTAATSVLALKHLYDGRISELGVVGSGFEAKAQLRAIADFFEISKVHVYSPTEQNRVAFAKQMSEELGLDITAVDDVVQAVSGHQMVVFATRSTTPVVLREQIDHGSILISIGSTRPDLRELDERILRDAQVVITDHPEQLMRESGDMIAARHLVDDKKLVPLSSLIAGEVNLADGELKIFKSTGTALQDLALAIDVYRKAMTNFQGLQIGNFPHLKVTQGG